MRSFGRALALSAALFLASSGLAGPKNASVERKSLNFEGHKRTYYVFVPDSPTPEGPAPLIVLLHGSGENGLSLADPWRSLAQREKIILVAPDSATSRTWDVHADHPDFIRAVVDAAAALHPVDPSRVYLFGHSGGGMYALTLSLLESQYFAAAAVHAGDLRDVTDETIERAQRKVPIALWSGTLDTRVSLSAVQRTQYILEEHGFVVELHEMPGRNHNYYVHSDDVNQSAWAFLSQHRLDDPPKFQSYKP